jgi:amidase
MQTIINAKPWLTEPALIPLPWSYQPISPTQKLKIGVMWHDGVVTPHPPITRALKRVVERLKKLPNVEVVDFEPYLHAESWAILSSLYFTDGGAADAATIAESGEPWRPLTTFIIKENPCVQKLSATKLYYWQEEREAYRKEYAKIWNDTGKQTENGELEGAIDVILCPVGPGVAPKHDTARYWGYTSQWNLLDYPALVFPVSRVDKKRDVWPDGWEELSELDADNHLLCKTKFRLVLRSLISAWEGEELTNESTDNPADFHDLPIALQLVGRRFEDEKVLAVLEHIKMRIELPLKEDL